jgi:hypothetical protein
MFLKILKKREVGEVDVRDRFERGGGGQITDALQLVVFYVNSNVSSKLIRTHIVLTTEISAISCHTVNGLPFTCDMSNRPVRFPLASRWKSIFASKASKPSRPSTALKPSKRTVNLSWFILKRRKGTQAKGQMKSTYILNKRFMHGDNAL